MKSFVLLATLLPTLALADPAIRPALGRRFLSGDLACGALAIYADDVNHDGRKDVIYVTNGRCDLYTQIHTALGRPDGSFEEAVESNLTSFNYYPHCGDRLVDVDGDGNL